MKLTSAVLVLCALFIGSCASSHKVRYKTTKVDAHFPMEIIKEFIYPNKEFLITDFGAKEGAKPTIRRLLPPLLKHAIKPVAEKWLFPRGDSSLVPYILKVMLTNTSLMVLYCVS